MIIYLKVVETSNSNLPLRLSLLYAFYKLSQIDECDEFFCQRPVELMQEATVTVKILRSNTTSSASRDSISATVKNWSSVEQ